MGADHDEILVTAYEGFFTKIKFKVLDAPILLRNVKIVFGNGESRNVKVNKKFTAGMESRVIDLPGNKRIIKKIVMNYTAVAKHKGKATFVVWGRHWVLFARLYKSFLFTNVFRLETSKYKSIAKGSYK